MSAVRHPSLRRPSLLAFAPIVPDPGKLFAGFDLASERRAVEAAEGAAGHPEGLLGDERFNLWVNGGITFHRDRTTSGQEGETITFGTGASWRFTPDINAGAAFRYARTDRDGASGETKADTWSVALFAQTKLVEEVMLNAIASYSRVDLDLGFKTGGVVTATGSTKADSLAGQLTVTRSFRLGDWQVTPNLGAPSSMSRATLHPLRRRRRARLGLDAGFGQRRADRQHHPLVGQPAGPGDHGEPSFGLQAYANVGKFDSVAGAAGARTENDTIGLSANAGPGRISAAASRSASAPHGPASARTSGISRFLRPAHDPVELTRARGQGPKPCPGRPRKPISPARPAFRAASQGSGHAAADR